MPETYIHEGGFALSYDLCGMSELVGLWSDAFPAELPADCDVTADRRFMSDRHGPSISVVTEHGGRAELIRRVQRVHPLDRPHTLTFDRQLWDTLCEAEAFGWAAAVRRLGAPRFNVDPSLPDVHVPGRAWIEVKAIRLSDGEDAVRRQAIQTVDSNPQTPFALRMANLESPHGTLLKKLEEAWGHALIQLDRGRDADVAAQPIVYIRIEGFDFNTSRPQAEAMVQGWATTKDPAQAELVILQGPPSGTPLFSSFR